MGSCQTKKEKTNRVKPTAIIKVDKKSPTTSESEVMKSLKNIFHQADLNHDGYLDRNDIAKIYQRQIERNSKRKQTTSIS